MCSPGFLLAAVWSWRGLTLLLLLISGGANEANRIRSSSCGSFAGSWCSLVSWTLSWERQAGAQVAGNQHVLTSSSLLLRSQVSCCKMGRYPTLPLHSVKRSVFLLNVRITDFIIAWFWSCLLLTWEQASVLWMNKQKLQVHHCLRSEPMPFTN